LQKLGLSPSGEECPELQGIREIEMDGSYALVLEFASPTVSPALWVDKKAKIESFFGPGIRADLNFPQDGKVEVALITVLTPVAVSPA
jgi:hypothetical protein